MNVANGHDSDCNCRVCQPYEEWVGGAPVATAPLSAKTGFFVKPEHSDKCYLAKQGRNEFIVYDGCVQLDRIGRKGGSTFWHKFTCNVIDCEATAYVRWDVLMVFVAGLVHASKEPTT